MRVFQFLFSVRTGLTRPYVTLTTVPACRLLPTAQCPSAKTPPWMKLGARGLTTSYIQRRFLQSLLQPRAYIARCASRSQSRWGYTIMLLFTVGICFVLLIRRALGAGDTCFMPTGQASEDWYFCNTTASSNGDGTACCRAGDTCMQSGVCFQGWDGVFYRGACSDPLWKSPNCMQMATEGLLISSLRVILSSPPTNSLVGMFNTSYEVWVMQCEMETKTWCVQVAATGDPCCNSTILGAVFSEWVPGYTIGLLTNDPSNDDVGRNLLEAQSTTPSTYTTTAMSLTTITATTTPTATALANGCATSNKVGIGIGVGLGIPLIILAVATIVTCSRRYCSGSRGKSGLPQNHERMSTEQMPSFSSYGPLFPQDLYIDPGSRINKSQPPEQPVNELGGVHYLPELSASRIVPELASREN